MRLTYLCNMLEHKDILRFLCRAGIQVASDDAVEKVRHAFAEFVFDVKKLALVNTEAGGRMTVRADDIVAALQAHSFHMHMYGIEESAHEVESTEQDEADSTVSNDSGDESASDVSNDSDSDAEDTMQEMENDTEDDAAFGEGEFSDAEETSQLTHDATYIAEDGLWTHADGFYRIEDTQMQQALASTSENSNPYLVSRAVLLQMWTAMTTLPITRAALSALHNAVEHAINRDLVHGKLGAQVLYCAMEAVAIQEATEADRLAQELAACQAELAKERAAATAGRKKRGLRDPTGEENAPPSPSMVTPVKRIDDSKRARTTPRLNV
ncbi:Aste57867_18993 [Aphanomyces stellatus]|uniref:Aste57867_18993 protein n=1 Tax=Aphanomyces stellatus TaxID=120398 RepID=A0A485LBG7_9STRA|nr:hypothetical protein As57867_018929 [Aphanomyces stellatus]VFT95719.1 Aste57867_18993 [Aphanomyces stellatus]